MPSYVRNKLKSSSNQDIIEIYITRGKNITYDQYKSTREAINDICIDVAIDPSTFTMQNSLHTTNEHIFNCHSLFK